MNQDSFPLPEIDLYSLHLLRSVAKFRGFTAASNACGLSQSALTRQVQAIESRLGIKVFDRTTRSVRITEAGAVLLRETEAIPNILRSAMRRLQEEYLGAAREIRIGLSRDLAQAHISGIFHAQQKLQPEVKVIVSQPAEADLVRLVGNAKCDLGILTLPAELPATVTITHRMTERLSIIVSSASAPAPVGSLARFREWAKEQQWLLPAGDSRSRLLVEQWARDQKVELTAAMELENFDLMIQLVSMGMGAAFVPRRSLGSFRRKRLLAVSHPPSKLERHLVVIAPNHSKCPEQVSRFVEGILFS